MPLAVVLVAVVAAQLILSEQFAAKINDLGRRLLLGQASKTPDVSLIPPMMRAFAIRNGGQVGGPSAVTMVQNAEMRLAGDQSFFKLEASQVSGTRQPGFVWQAKGMMNTIVPLHVVDAYVENVGELEVRIAGSIPVDIRALRARRRRGSPLSERQGWASAR